MTVVYIGAIALGAVVLAGTPLFPLVAVLLIAGIVYQALQPGGIGGAFKSAAKS